MKCLELGEPCQLFKLNERNRKIKLTILYLGTSFRGLLLTSSGAME